MIAGTSGTTLVSADSASANGSTLIGFEITCPNHRVDDPGPTWFLASLVA
jgi:hypothetical protein